MLIVSGKIFVDGPEPWGGVATVHGMIIIRDGVVRRVGVETNCRFTPLSSKFGALLVAFFVGEVSARPGVHSGCHVWRARRFPYVLSRAVTFVNPATLG